MFRTTIDAALLLTKCSIAGAALSFFALLPGVIGLFGMVAGAVLASAFAGMLLRRGWLALVALPLAAPDALPTPAPEMVIAGK